MKVSPKVELLGDPVNTRSMGSQTNPYGGLGHVKYIRLPVGELPEIVMGSMLTYWIQLVEGRLGRNAVTAVVATRKGNFKFEFC